MDAPKVFLIVGAVVIIAILFYSSVRFVGTFEKTTTGECTQTDFRSAQGTVQGEVLKGYTCPEGYRQEFADFKDVPRFSLCCVKN